MDAEGGRSIPGQVDHGDAEQIAALFERVKTESGHSVLLVNNVYEKGGGWKCRHHRSPIRASFLPDKFQAATRLGNPLRLI